MTQSNILLEAGTNELEIVEFYLEEENPDGTVYTGYYGVNVAKVLEIIRLPKVTELPEARQACVMGAFNLRSEVIPLVDLGAWLGKKSVPSDNAKVIVTEFNNVDTAFLVSGVNRIHRLSWEEVEAPGRYVSTASKHTVTGVVKLDERIIFILDLERVVSDLNPELGLRFDEDMDWSDVLQYRALVADDSTMIREMLKQLLEKANFIVQPVTTGREAWEALLEIKQHSIKTGRPIEDYVQCVVSDIEMPQMDGHNLCLRIKEDPVLKTLPVLLFSSLITDRLKHKGDTVGADAQISKPEVTTLAQQAVKLIRQRVEERKAAK